MTILMIIFVIISLLGLIIFSFKNKEYYQNETIEASTSEALGVDKLMDVNKFIKEVNEVDWHKFKGPEYYKPDSVPRALIALVLVDVESKNKYNFIGGVTLNPEITRDLMYSIGNDHRGSYYPALQKALGFIIQVALFGNHEVARNCAINVLTDLFCSFYPESGVYDLLESEQLDNFVKKSIADNKTNFIQLQQKDTRNKELIQSLIEAIDDVCKDWKQFLHSFTQD